MLLLPSRTSTHSAAPFFSLLGKGSLHFTASFRANSHWTNMKFCSLSEQLLLFNPAFEIASNLHKDERYDVLEFGLFFFRNIHSENVSKIVHFIPHCIRHSILF